MPVNTNTESLNTMYTTTWYLRKKKVIDQIFEATPFWLLLKRKGKITTQSGGREIEVPLRYAKNETVQYIGKGGSVTLQDTDPLTVAQYPWRYLTGHIIRYFADFQKNRSEAQLINKVNSDIDTLQASLIDQLEESLFNDGTGDNSNEINGLLNLVAEAPTTGTVGGINRATYSWWRNYYFDMSSYAASIYLRKRMNIAFNECGKYGEGVTRFPDLIVCAQDVHEFYESELVEIARVMINDKKLADLGFGDLAYKGRPMTWSPSCPSGSLYLLNTNHLEFIADPIENFSLGEWLPIVNQPRDVVAHTMTVGNLCLGNARKQGVLFDIAE